MRRLNFLCAEGFNHSVAHWDPTSHGEIEAVRDACRRLQTVDLSGCDLYSSCEPCALCVAAMHIAGIEQLYYAASLEQSGQAIEGVSAADRHPIDCEALRAESGAPRAQRRLAGEQHLPDPAVAVVKAWARQREAT